jgi:hypothetical protein
LANVQGGKRILPLIFLGLGLGVGFCIMDGLYGSPGGICF